MILPNAVADLGIAIFAGGGRQQNSIALHRWSLRMGDTLLPVAELGFDNVRTTMNNMPMARIKIVHYTKISIRWTNVTLVKKKLQTVCGGNDPHGLHTRTTHACSATGELERPP